MNHTLSKKSILAYAFLLSLLFLFWNGYRFNSGDQAECLPQVYQLIDPELYRGDFFIQEYHTAFTVRFYFIHLIYALSHVASVAAVCFTFLVFSLFLSVYYFIEITQHFTGSKVASLLSPVLAFFMFYDWTIGGNHIQTNILVPGAISVVFGIAGIYLFLKEKIDLSFITLGVGTLFQPLVTMQVFMVLMTILAWDSRNGKIIIAAKAAIMYLLPASFMLVPAFYRQFLELEPSKSALYYEVLFRFRNHLHYLPSLFPVVDYIGFAALFSSALLASRFSDIRNRRFIYFFSGIILCGMVGYLILLEVMGISAIGKLQWFKATIWVNAMACIALAAFVGNHLDRLVKFNFERTIVPFSLVGGGVLLFVLFNSASLTVEKLQYRYQVGNHRKSDLTVLHEWIEQNLPKDALILCDPSNTSLICEAKRGQVVQYQAIIHEPFYMLEWYNRFNDVYGVGLETTDRQDIRQQASELYTIRNFKSNKYEIDYRIDNIRTCRYTSELGKVVYQSGDYVLTEFIPDLNM